MTRRMPMSTTVGMVPAMFQVPIRAPTANRMKTAPMAAVTPPTAASATAATVCPFLKAMRLAKAALSSSATWSGPSVALTPNSEMVSASRPISTTIGSSASRRLGSRGPAVGCSLVAIVQPVAIAWRPTEPSEPTWMPWWCSSPRAQTSMQTTRAAASTATIHRAVGFMTTHSQGVTQQRARHAVAAAAPLAQLEPLDRDHLDPGLPHLVDGVRVARVGDHHTRLQGDHVVAVVPLLPLLLVGVAAGLHDPQVGDAEGVRDGSEEAGLLGHVELALA